MEDHSDLRIFLELNISMARNALGKLMMWSETTHKNDSIDERTSISLEKSRLSGIIQAYNDTLSRLPVNLVPPEETQDANDQSNL